MIDPPLVRLQSADVRPVGTGPVHIGRGADNTSCKRHAQTMRAPNYRQIDMCRWLGNNFHDNKQGKRLYCFYFHDHILALTLPSCNHLNTIALLFCDDWVRQSRWLNKKINCFISNHDSAKQINCFHHHQVPSSLRRLAVMINKLIVLMVTYNYERRIINTYKLGHTSNTDDEEVSTSHVDLNIQRVQYISSSIITYILKTIHH